LPNIPIIQIEQIERIENWTALAKKKFIEDASALGIQAHKFTVDHSILCLQPGEMCAQFSKTFVGISSSRNQFTMTIGDVRQCPETVVF
jgi:hypothetical protein